MKKIGHYIAGSSVVGQGASPIFDPATGLQSGYSAVGTAVEVDAAIAAAKKAFAAWSVTGLQHRIAVMLEIRTQMQAAREEITGIVVSELGKTYADAAAEVERAIEVLGQAASLGSWYGTCYSPTVSRDVDAYEVRFPIGVIAAISPFNFPVLIPVVQCAMAIACGNTIVLKPSDRDPSASRRIAEIFSAGGLPAGVLNVILGGRDVGERLVSHPDVAGITFVGSTPIARAIRAEGVKRNKRVQAFGGGKNHMVVMDDADLDVAADAAVSAAFGAAGQRCMAVSVVVAVGNIADQLVGKIADRIQGMVTGNPADPTTHIGPVVSLESQRRIVSYLDSAEENGATLVTDGRRHAAQHGGWYIAPSLVDHVTPEMVLHRDEIFGPVLSVVRAASFDEAAEIIAAHPLGNGASIFSNNGAIVRRFINEIEAGQIGVNVAIPFPVFFHNFAGWKDSAFTESKLFGPGALAFCTRTKTVSARWPETNVSKVDLGFPLAR